MPASAAEKHTEEETLSPSDTNSDAADAWLNLGKQQWDAGDFLGAVVSYDKAADEWFNQGNQQYEAGNFLGAVASYDKAVQINPDYHEAWYNRGSALVNLGQYEQAIASFDKALQINSDYYEAWHNRGALLCDHLQQYKQAIASFDKALQINPNLYQAWNNQGIALDKLGQYEQAITSFDKAVQINPDFHQAWHGWGRALYKLGQYEQAIASFDKAVEINPDFHQAWDYRGRALEHLRQYEQAIASYDKAVQIKPDYHEAWNNRGIAAGESRKYNPQAAIMLQMQFPKSPIVKPNPTLNERGYEGQLLSLQEGLKHCPEPESQGFLHQAIGITHYQEGQKKRNYREYCHKAINSYEEALKTLTQDAFPELHLEVLQNYIKPLSALGETEKAVALTKRGSDLLRRLLSKPNRSDFSKKQLTVKFINLQQLTVDLYVQLGQPIKALEEAEADKNACLTWLLSNYSEEISSAKYNEIQQLLNPTTAIIYWHLSPAALTTFIIKPGAAEPIVIEEPLPNSLLRGEGVRAESDTNTPLNSLNSPPLLRGAGGDLPPSDTPKTSLKRLQNFEAWVKDWDEQYQNYRRDKKVDPPQPPLTRGENELPKNWRDNLPGMLENLKTILNLPAILSELTDIKQLILIPHRDLHRFPIHALFPNTFNTTYLPSAQLGLNLSNSPFKTNLLSVEYPNSRGFNQLPYAEIESTAISQLFETPKRISGQDATKTVVQENLAANYNIFHFTGHGSYNFEAPKQSALFLSEEDCLTFLDITQIPLISYQLVTLAACETGLKDNQSITDEFVGLVSAFLYRQTTHVVSTLWTIPEEASSLLMIYFYWQLKKGKTPILALDKAVNWLRNLTDAKLERLYKVIFTKLPRKEQPLRPFLRNQLSAIKKKTKSEKQQKKFDHPYFWAAFTITGNINHKSS